MTDPVRLDLDAGGAAQHIAGDAAAAAEAVIVIGNVIHRISRDECR